MNLCDYNWWITATEADVQAALDGGADVMARDNNTYTPLHRAAEYNTTATIQALLAAGADLMARTTTGRTPLHSAAEVALAGSAANIQALLDANADAKVKNEEGKTPRDLAQENEKLKGTRAYWALNDAQYN